MIEPQSHICVGKYDGHSNKIGLEKRNYDICLKNSIHWTQCNKTTNGGMC